MFFDLDGFKDYNDAFGHPAGDALLGRLAPALATVGGRAYRLGGDEFCLLLDGASAMVDPLVKRAVDALSARGDGFSIGASHGLVVMPEDAADATEALRSPTSACTPASAAVAAAAARRPVTCSSA